MATPLRLVALLAVAALVAGGCSGDDGDDAGEIDGTGYAYAVPDGWGEATEDALDLQLEGVRIDSAVTGEREDDFTTNVNVTREGGVPDGVSSAEYADVSLESLRDPAAAGLPPEIVAQVESLDVEGVRRLPGTELGGRDAVVWEYRAVSQGKATRVRQLTAVMDGAGYTVTLTAVPDAFEEGAGALDEVVESWEWD
jgi:hypothetical protein